MDKTHFLEHESATVERISALRIKEVDPTL